MKREFLKAMGLNDEQIDKIMDEHGKTTNSLKTENETYKTELNSTKEQLSEANKAIDSYKGMNIEDIKKSAEEYKTKYEESEKTSKESIEKLKLEHAIESELLSSGAINIKAVKALIEEQNIILDDKGITGLKEQIEALKSAEDSKMLFKSDTVKIDGTKPGQGTEIGSSNGTLSLGEAVKAHINSN